jgi:hypothetical protein
MKTRFAPALTLFFITPLIAEYLLGSLSLAQAGAYPVLCCMYGCANVLIREAARTRNRGWNAVLFLGLAYAVLEEALATQSLFNPNYLHLRLLDYGFLPAFGLGANWTCYVLGLHVVWSICVPIGVVEALFPRQAAEPWLGWPSRIIFMILLCGGLFAVAAFTYKMEHFMAAPVQLLISAILALALVFFGLRQRSPKQLTAASVSSKGPRPLVLGGFAFVAGSLFELTQSLHNIGVHWSVPVLSILALLFGGWVMLLRASRSPYWNAWHAFSITAGGLLVYCWWGYTVEVSLHGRDGLVFHTILVFLALTVLFVAGRNTRRFLNRSATEFSPESAALQPF